MTAEQVRNACIGIVLVCLCVLIFLAPAWPENPVWQGMR